MKTLQKLQVMMLLIVTSFASAQYITIDDSFSASALISTKLINSPCANAENFFSSGGTFAGSSDKSFGYFERGTSNFPFTNGIVLTSSRARRTIGPNSGDLSEGNSTWAGDSDLEAALNNANTFNATVLEFDFTPLNSNFSFNYIFASEEYSLDYPCLYSDGFAFLLKPAAGNQPYRNLAVIPNTVIPVSSNSIRPQITTGMQCGARNAEFFNGYNTGASAINFNGQTVVMTAKANVIPGVKYRIKLVIADQDDSSFDSAIFIEGGSFNISADLGPDRTLLAGNPICGNENFVLNATIPGTNAYKWFRNGVLLASETQPTLTATQNGTYKVEITAIGSTCIAESEIALQFTPAFNLDSKTIKQCDTNLDLIVDVNLRQIEQDVTSNFADCTFRYYRSEAAAIAQNPAFLIPNPSSYNNASGNEVWIRVQNAFGCAAVIKLTLVISATQLPADYSQTLSRCDDFLNTVNNDSDGITLFNFNPVSASLALLLPNPSNYQIRYYKTENDFNMESDAQGNSLAIANIQNYRNIGFANNQTIWIKVNSTIDKSCFGFGKLFLVVEKKPVANSIAEIRRCDDNPNDAVQVHAFDTSTIQNMVLGSQNPSNFVVSYFDENNLLLPSPLSNPFVSGTQKIRIRVTNAAGNDPNGKCFVETLLQLTVDKQPIANSVVVPIACSSNNLNGVYTTEFDTSNFTSTILGAQTGMTIKYFDANNQPLNPLPNPYVSTSQTIRAVVENPLNVNCSATTLIDLRVNVRPDVTLTSENYICFGSTNSTTISSGLQNSNTSDFTFKWFKDNIEIGGETNETLVVNSDGIYVCEVTNIQTGCTQRSTNKVIFSETANITSLIINDLVENNNLNVVVSGRGTYEFSIDEPNGPFQSSGYFANIAPGFHTLYINDKQGCEIVKKTFAVVGIMSFFTPNGDSYNDFWKISGISASRNAKSKVQIFDRYGRLLYEIQSGASVGWDGTCNGEPMPADDYWFTMTLEDGRSTSGHFALKR